MYSTLCLLLCSLAAYGQGSSKILYPSGASGNRAYLVCTLDPGSNENSWPYLTEGTHYVYAVAGEVIAASFSARSNGTDGGAIRFTSPTNVVTLTGTGNVVTTGAASALGGLIANRTQELAGPWNGQGSQGNMYTPCTITVPAGQTGVWKVEFLPIRNNTQVPSETTDVGTISANGNWTQPGPGSESRAFVAAWDVSVRSGTTWKSGRVYTTVLNLLLTQEWESSESFYTTMYTLTKDGIAYKITYNGNQGAGWTIFTNNKGFIGLDGYASYKSKNFSAYDLIDPYLHDPTSQDDVDGNYITHKMFYTTPGTDLPNTLVNEVAIAGGGTTWLKNPRLLPEMDNLTFQGVEGTPGQSGSKGAYIRFESNVKGLYKITIPSTPPKVLTGPCDIGMNEVFWDGTNGNGTLLPAGTSITQVTTQLYGAEVHFPYIDMEINPKGIIIEQLNDSYVVMPGMDKVYWDDTDITGGNALRRPNPMFNGNTGTGISSNTNGHKWGAYTTATVNPSGIPTWTGQPDNDGQGSGDFGNTRSIDTWSYAPGAEVSAALQIIVMATDLRVDSVTKTSGPNTVSVGNSLTYDVAIFNDGPSEATTANTSPATFFFYAPPGITITPALVTFTNSVNGAAIAGTKTFDPVTGIFKVTVDMPNQSGGTFHIPVSVTGGVPDDKVNVWGAIMRPQDISDPNATNLDITITQPEDAFEEANEIWADSSTLPLYTNPSSIDLTDTNNIKYNDAVQMYANVSLTKSVSPASGHSIGQNVTFTITATNNGISTANYVEVIDLLNSRYTYVSHSTATGTYTPGSGVWNIGVLNNAAVATLTIVATIKPTGDEQINTATITADEYDTVLANNTASATTDAVVSTTLEITKIGSRTGNNSGTASFTLTVHNNGPGDASSISVADNLTTYYTSPGANYIASTGTVAYSGTGNRNITWSIPFLASGGTATLVFNAAFSKNNNENQNVLNNTATVTCPQSASDSDSVVPANTGTSVNLAVTKAVSNATPNVGANVTFTVVASRVAGQNGVSVTGVVVTDNLPPGYTYVSHTATGTTYVPATGIWTVGTLNDANSSRTLTIVATVKPPTGATDEYKNVAAITGTSEADGTLLNNIANISVDPLEADLEVDKTADAMQVKPNNTVQFTITVDNNGPDAATSVNITDLLPAGYTFVSAVASAGTYTSGTGVWALGTMANAARETLVITATVLSGNGSLTNTASAVATTTYDPVLSNNSDYITISRKLSYVVTNPMVRARVH
jgi:uncharacterized repeat protein (TIGR01451 family)